MEEIYSDTFFDLAYKQDVDKVYHDIVNFQNQIPSNTNNEVRHLKFLSVETTYRKNIV